MTDDNPAESRSSDENCEELTNRLIEKILDLELKIEEQSDEIDELKDELAALKQ